MEPSSNTSSSDSPEGGAPQKRSYETPIIFAVVAIAAAAAALIGSSNPMAATLSRWVGCLALIYYGIRRRRLTTWILISMVIGTEVGHDFSNLGIGLRMFSIIFLRMIKTVVAPLLFATLVVGIAGHANLREVGRMGLKAIIYFEIITTLALMIGLGAINLTHAGVGVQAPQVAAGGDTIEKAKPMTTMEIIVHAFPENIAKSVSENQVLQIVVFSVLFGIALAQVPAEQRQPCLHLAESLAEVMFKFTNMVMLFAPIGVGSAIAYTVGHMGLGILGNLAQLVGTLYLALILLIVLVLMPVMLIFHIDIKRFFKAIAEPVTLAFATTSSEAALPRAMENMIKFGVPRHVVAFVLPTGYSFNLDGTSLYLSLATVFVAQAAGIHLSFEHQILIMITLMLTSKGVAGVPRASLIILLGTAASFGLPEWPILAILGVDELMDMGRTATNVIGNCLASAVVARSEGILGNGNSANNSQPSTITTEQLATAG